MLLIVSTGSRAVLRTMSGTAFSDVNVNSITQGSVKTREF
jgi:hypothetical protein